MTIDISPRHSSTLTSRFVGKLPASRFIRFAFPVLAPAHISLSQPLPNLHKKVMYKGIVKKQVPDGPRLRPCRFCSMGRQSRSKGREWDRNRMSMGRQWDAKMLREH
jgi:hypothetical protein